MTSSAPVGAARSRAAGVPDAGVLSYEDYLATRRFAPLDGLRAIAVLLVFTAHPAYEHGWPLLHGQTGVTLFFVLSGFLITTLLLREERRYGRVSFAAFYLRRTFRIYPMYFAILGLYCGLILVAGFQSDRRGAFLDNLAYMVFGLPEHAIFYPPAGVLVPFDGAWSIGIEEKFYFVWPLLAFAVLAGVRRSWRLPVAGLLAVAGLIAGSLGSDLDVVKPYQHLLYGVLVALLLDRRESYAWLARLGRPRVLLALTVVAVVVLLSTDEILLYGGALYGVYGVLLAALLAGVVTTRTRAIGWLSSRPMVRLGALSYVLYLIHNFFLNAAEAVLPSTWGFAGSLLSTVVGIGAAVVAAQFIHRYFEEPLREFGVRLARRVPGRRPPLATGVAELDPLAPREPADPPLSRAESR